MDIVGGATASLCEAYRHVVTELPGGGQGVNLLFDQETDGIKVESPYPSGKLRITAKRPGPISVRIPPWADPAAIAVDGTDGALSDTAITISNPPAGTPITITLPLTEHEINLPHRTRTIRTRMRGDEVIAMDNFGADLTFFPPI